VRWFVVSAAKPCCTIQCEKSLWGCCSHLKRISGCWKVYPFPVKRKTTSFKTLKKVLDQIAELVHIWDGIVTKPVTTRTRRWQVAGTLLICLVDVNARQNVFLKHKWPNVTELSRSWIGRNYVQSQIGKGKLEPVYSVFNFVSWVLLRFCCCCCCCFADYSKEIYHNVERTWRATVLPIKPFFNGGSRYRRRRKFTFRDLTKTRRGRQGKSFYSEKFANILI